MPPHDWREELKEFSHPIKKEKVISSNSLNRGGGGQLELMLYNQTLKILWHA